MDEIRGKECLMGEKPVEETPGKDQSSVGKMNENRQRKGKAITKSARRYWLGCRSKVFG